MTREELLSEINDIFIDVLDDEDIVIEEKTTSEDVEEWDSLNHIHLVVGVEKRFKLRFTSSEIQSWANVGEMMDNLMEKGV
ncbi:MAG: acyl carrier protein [Schleiferiaceae bacterium]|jgi:acyl carrier protein